MRRFILYFLDSGSQQISEVADVILEPIGMQTVQGSRIARL